MGTAVRSVSIVHCSEGEEIKERSHCGRLGTSMWITSTTPRLNCYLSGGSSMQARAMCSASTTNSSSIGLATLSHVTPAGDMPCMVDVSAKTVTRREAMAQAVITLPPHVMKELGVQMCPPPAESDDAKSDDNSFHTPALEARGSANGSALGGLPLELMSKKGPVFATAVVAGVMAAKNTSSVIPFCHPLMLERCDVDIQVTSPEHVLVTCTVGLSGKTGVEMEALNGATSAALCIYDMVKALSHNIVVSDIRLCQKTGGKSDFVSPSFTPEK